MKIQSICDSPTDTGPETANCPSVDHVLCGRKGGEIEVGSNKAQTDLATQIFLVGNGRGMVKFCRELSAVIIRQYSVETDVDAIRSKVSRSLVTILRCSDMQADCLFELSLELINARLHGHYRRSNLEISYLIAMASGAVADVSAN